MSKFLKEFETILKEESIGSGTRIFEIAGVDKSTLSRIRAGKQTLQFEHLAPIAAAIAAEVRTTDEEFYCRLLRARLLEECSDARARNIKIEISESRRNLSQETGEPQFFASLPEKQREALKNIAMNLQHDANLRSTILWLGGELFAGKNADVRLMPNDQSGRRTEASQDTNSVPGGEVDEAAKKVFVAGAADAHGGGSPKKRPREHPQKPTNYRHSSPKKPASKHST